MGAWTRGKGLGVWQRRSWEKLGSESGEVRKAATAAGKACINNWYQSEVVTFGSELILVNFSRTNSKAPAVRALGVISDS